MKRVLLILAAMVVLALMVSVRQLRADAPSCSEYYCEYNHYCTDELPIKCDLCWVHYCWKVAD
jgi:hypothetical protein